MPKITQYDTPEGIGLRPTETGISAVAGAARRLQGDYSEAAAAQAGTGHRLGSAISTAGEVAVKYIDHQQIAAGLAHGAELFDTLGKSKDDAIKKIDPNDPTYGVKVELAVKEWREKTLEPALENFNKGFITEKGQAWAEHFVGQTRNHMFVESSADVSRAASIGIGNAVKTFTNESSNAAIRRPESVDTLLQQTEHSVAGLVSTSPISGVQAAKVQTEVMEKAREQIVKAGAIGAIRQSADPEKTANEWIEKYPQYINGHEAKILADNARLQIRARNADAEHQDRKEKQEKIAISSEAADQYLIEAASKSPRLVNDPLAQKVLNDVSLTKNDRKNLLNYIDAKLKPEAAKDISAANTIEFLKELSPDARKELDAKDFEDRVWKARTKNPGDPEAINEHDFMMLRKELDDRKTPEGLALSNKKTKFLEGVSEKIYKANPLLGKTDPDGKINLYRLKWDIDQKIDEYKKAGKNPYDLFDPHKPDFMGTDAALMSYQKPLSESIKDQARRLGVRARTSEEPGSKNLTGPGKDVISIVPVEENTPPSKPLRKPGESPAQYLKRTGLEF